MPSVKKLSQAIKEYKKTLVFSETDIRLQVYNGRWSLYIGSSDYDQDHRGEWSSGILSQKTNCRVLAIELLEQLPV